MTMVTVLPAKSPSLADADVAAAAMSPMMIAAIATDLAIGSSRQPKNRTA
jgi:hypothetical protein